MGQFACIQFNQDNILISKKQIAQVSQCQYLGCDGYLVKLKCSIDEMDTKRWKKLDQQLGLYPIEYIISDECIPYTFNEKFVIKGEEIKPYFAKLILDYICKYNLIDKKPMFLKVGIIGGQINQMMGVILSIMDAITDLTLFTELPYIYASLLSEIYSETRLKARSLVPNSTTLRSMDIIFDCSGTRNYAKWCNPKAIYIDINQYFSRRTTIFERYPPIIWYDFDIVCDGQLISQDLLQSILLSQGISKRSIPLAFKKMQLKIGQSYTVKMS